MYQVLKESALPDARAAIRSGRYAAHTAGLGKGFLQANLAIMLEGFALDFMRFCQRKPRKRRFPAGRGTGTTDRQGPARVQR